MLIASVKTCALFGVDNNVRVLQARRCILLGRNYAAVVVVCSSDGAAGSFPGQQAALPPLRHFYSLGHSSPIRHRVPFHGFLALKTIRALRPVLSSGKSGILGRARSTPGLCPSTVHSCGRACAYPRSSPDSTKSGKKASGEEFAATLRDHPA